MKNTYKTSQKEDFTGFTTEFEGIYLFVNDVASPGAVCVSTSPTVASLGVTAILPSEELMPRYPGTEPLNHVFINVSRLIPAKICYPYLIC